jgi:heterotetrameric sarcosine oxidase gamma subunit
MTKASLIARGGFAGLPGPPSAAAAIRVTERNELGIATFLVRRGQRAALGERWRKYFNAELPNGPTFVASNGVSVTATSPDSWLAIQQTTVNTWARSLEVALSGCASVTDQSDGYAVLRLEGPQVRATLAKLVPIDLHERTFPVGATAGTLAAHIGAFLWRNADGADGQPVFEIAVTRSMAASFWHALTAGAAEFGLARGPHIDN